ncbi:hypothetical protein Tco_1430785 [Tanacetum coccineum]
MILTLYTFCPIVCLRIARVYTRWGEVVMVIGLEWGEDFGGMCRDEIAEPISFSPDRRGLVKRWHVCKPVHVTYDDGNGKDYRMWPICNPESTFCFGYNEVFGVNDQGCVMANRKSMIQYGNDNITNGIGHNNLHESDREFIFNEWILDSYDVEDEYAREIGDPYFRRFDEYNRTFNNDIEHLSNEYILRIGKKGYVLDDIWEKYQQNYKKTNEAWYDEAYEEDEMWRIGDEKTDYDPPYVNVKTFEVKNIFLKEDVVLYALLIVRTKSYH